MPGSRPRIDARRASGSAMVCTITMSSAGGVVRLTPLMWEAEYLILKAVKPSPPFIGAFQLMITSSQLLTSIGSSMNGWPGEAARGTPRRLRQDYGGRTALQWEGGAHCRSAASSSRERAVADAVGCTTRRTRAPSSRA